VRGQTGKGANLSFFGGASKACAAGGQEGEGCLFRTPFATPAGWLLAKIACQAFIVSVIFRQP